MKLELTYSERDKEVSINSLSPSAIKKLLRQVLQKNPPNLKRYTVRNEHSECFSEGDGHPLNTKQVICLHPLSRGKSRVSRNAVATVERSFTCSCSCPRRSVIWDRQLDGALNRVPPGFYDEVWSILARTPQGLKVAGYLLPQVSRLCY